MDLNAQLKPTVISNPHPIIGDGRVNYFERFKAGETLGEYVKRVGVEIPKGSFVVIINGCAAVHDWRLYVLQEGDDIIFRSSALGGGGGGGKVLRLVAMVAVMAVAAWAGPAAATAMGFTSGTTAFSIASAVVGGAVMVAGSMLVNAIFPPPKPQLPNMTDKEQSPTYGINAGRNQANPYGPMLIVFGRHKVVPFLASKTYTTFDGDNQYLSQAFHFGLQPDLNLEKILIGDTDISAYKDVQIEKSSDNGRLSLVSGNVDVIEGFEVYKSSGWVSRTTPDDTTHISIDVAGNLFDIADNGDERGISVSLILQYKKTDSTTWLSLSGGSVHLSGSNPQKPTRLTINQYVDKGQYDVRISKASDDISTTRKSNKVTIAQIRCTQEDSADYTGQLRVAVKIKATSQLNGAIDELSAIASAKCPMWNGGAWEVKETSNPAWWFLWWARGKRDANFKRLYGECLPDTRIDIDAIKAWAAFCDRKNLSFNWVLDRKMSIEEVYYTIARAGRASTTWQTGKRGVIWDSDELPVTTLLTPANIIAGSFSYKHINTDVADEIIINYYDANKDWEKAVVRQKVPNATQANNPITLDLEGCTNESQAGREANLLAASQQLHRKQYSFEMDIEGAVLARGDVAQLTHDLTSFAAGGRLVAVNGNVLTLDADVGTATNAWLTLRSPFNQMYNVRVNARGNQLTLVNGWTFGDVGNVEDWLWQYDPSKIAGVKLQIKSVVPQSNGNIKFEAIEYSPAYFASENNVYFAVPQKQARDLPAIYVFDALSTERILNEGSGETEVTISWLASEQSDADVIIKRGSDVLFNDRVHGSAVSVVAREGDTLDVEIVPFADRRTSRVFSKSFVVVGTNIVIEAPTNLQIIGAFTKSAVTIKWDRVSNAVGYEVQVLSDSTVRRTLKVGDVLTYTYAFADMSQDGGAVRSLTFKVRALGRRSAKSSWVSVSGKNPQVAALQGIKVESNIKSLMFTCEKPQDEDFAGYLVWISDDKNFLPTLNNVAHDGAFNQVFLNSFNEQPLEQKDYYIWCAGYDAFGKDELNISGYFTATPIELKLGPKSITADMIADGILDKTKFAASIKIPVAVDELPDDGKVGDIVILKSTGDIYTFNGEKWTNDIPDGSVTGDKVASGTLTTSHIQLDNYMNLFRDPALEHVDSADFWKIPLNKTIISTKDQGLSLGFDNKVFYIEHDSEIPEVVLTPAPVSGMSKPRNDVERWIKDACEVDWAHYPPPPPPNLLQDAGPNWRTEYNRWNDFIRGCDDVLRPLNAWSNGWPQRQPTEYRCKIVHDLFSKYLNYLVDEWPIPQNKNPGIVDYHWNFWTALYTALELERREKGNNPYNVVNLHDIGDMPKKSELWLETSRLLARNDKLRFFEEIDGVDDQNKYIAKYLSDIGFSTYGKLYYRNGWLNLSETEYGNNNITLMMDKIAETFSRKRFGDYPQDAGYIPETFCPFAENDEFRVERPWGFWTFFANLMSFYYFSNYQLEDASPYRFTGTLVERLGLWVDAANLAVSIDDVPVPPEEVFSDDNWAYFVVKYSNYLGDFSSWVDGFPVSNLIESIDDTVNLNGDDLFSNMYLSFIYYVKFGDRLIAYSKNIDKGLLQADRWDFWVFYYNLQKSIKPDLLDPPVYLKNKDAMGGVWIDKAVGLNGQIPPPPPNWTDFISLNEQFANVSWVDFITDGNTINFTDVPWENGFPVFTLSDGRLRNVLKSVDILRELDDGHLPTSEVYVKHLVDNAPWNFWTVVYAALQAHILDKNELNRIEEPHYERNKYYLDGYVESTSNIANIFDGDEYSFVFKYRSYSKGRNSKLIIKLIPYDFLGNIIDSGIITKEFINNNPVNMPDFYAIRIVPARYTKSLKMIIQYDRSYGDGGFIIGDFQLRRAISYGEIGYDVVDTNNLRANAVTAGKIAAAAVGADQIAAGAISAKHLTVGDMSNIVLNGNQQFGLEGYENGWTNYDNELYLMNPDTGSPTGRAVRFTRRDAIYRCNVQVTAGDFYYCKFSCYRSGVAKNIGVGLRLKDKNGNIFSWVLGATKNANTSGWTTHEGILTVPAGAVTADVWLLIDGAHEDTSTTAYMSAIEVRRVSGSTMIADGVIKTQHMVANSINGNVIAANTLNGDRIIANTIHGDKIIGGTIHGNKIIGGTITGDKIVVNSITGDKLSVNELSAISSNLGEIQGGSLSIGGGRFGVDQWGNVSIKSAHTGQRMVIMNNRLEVYDGNNVLRVRVGIW